MTSNSKKMKFGTGGLRGLVGTGTDKMNIHTVRCVSQAFSEILLKKYDNPSVAIAHDNRMFSDEFTFESACVFAANGIKVYVFKDLMPTPMLSYAVRALKTSGGVVVTASHNPKEYNGYKIYDNNGCQYLPDEASEVSDIMDGIHIYDDIKTCAQEYEGTVSAKMAKAVSNNPLIEFISDEIIEDYYSKVLSEKCLSDYIKNVNVVYTPLNGAGNIPVTTVLERAGIGSLTVVESQREPDPMFTTCPRPNPEEEDALKEGLKLCRELKKRGKNPDLLLATDPDSDRVGVVVSHNDEFVRLDGNQVGVLLFDYIVGRRKEQGNMPKEPIAITTVVSTPMMEEIAYKKQIHVDKVLTGFKFIGGKIHDYELKGEEDRYVFGFEESCGYLAGTYVRDKDAVSTSLIIAEMAGYYKKEGKTLIDRLSELYEEYGYFITGQRSIEEAGIEGAEKIQKIMEHLRSPEVFHSFSQKVVQLLDYEEGTNRTMGMYEDQESGCAMAIGTRPINLPKENVLEFNFRNYSKAIIRPSGTEPKIKIYLFASNKDKGIAEKNMEIVEKEFMDLVGNM